MGDTTHDGGCRVLDCGLEQSTCMIKEVCSERNPSFKEVFRREESIGCNPVASRVRPSCFEENRKRMNDGREIGQQLRSRSQKDRGYFPAYAPTTRVWKTGSASFKVPMMMIDEARHVAE